MLRCSSLRHVAVLVFLLSHAMAFAADDPERPAENRAAPKWTGGWSCSHGVVGSSSVTIGELKEGKSFDFSFEGSHGVNFGEFDGTATLVSAEVAIGRVDECTVTFQLRPEFLEVSTTPQCDGFGGLGVHFDGKYPVGGAKARPMPTLFESGALYSTKQQAEFDALVGAHLSRFVIVVEGSQEDVDGFGAKVTSGCMVHQCDQSSIVMATPQGHLWAATSDPENKVILYFSNVADWVEELPATIKAWAAEYQSYVTVYVSTKAPPALSDAHLLYRAADVTDEGWTDFPFRVGGQATIRVSIEVVAGAGVDATVEAAGDGRASVATNAEVLGQLAVLDSRSSDRSAFLPPGDYVLRVREQSDANIRLFFSADQATVHVAVDSPPVRPAWSEPVPIDVFSGPSPKTPRLVESAATLVASKVPEYFYPACEAFRTPFGPAGDAVLAVTTDAYYVDDGERMIGGHLGVTVILPSSEALTMLVGQSTGDGNLRGVPEILITDVDGDSEAELVVLASWDRGGSEVQTNIVIDYDGSRLTRLKKVESKIGGIAKVDAVWRALRE